VRYIRLGKSDLEVSRLGLDCYSLGIAQRDHGWDPSSYDGRIFATRTVHAALDAGINIFETSLDAGGGLAQSLLGKALQVKQSDALLASRFWDAANDSCIEESILASMRRLRADHLDIVYLSDRLAQRVRALDELVRLRELGVVHHIGLIATDPGMSQPLITNGQFDVIELQCDVSDTKAVSMLLDDCAIQGMGVSINKPLASGTLQTLVRKLGEECTGASKFRECCLKYLLSDRRIHLINLGMRWEHEVATNSRLVANL
jgi:predicted aldo/keto reductase-like oxidoreductase